MANRLIHSSSPYLLQHADNPVDWFPWGEEALEKAKNEDKLIFLSIGYSSCHWCHVMERESFEDPEIARILNTHFVPIKVDREERPDIDALYMEAVQMMSGQGGWPLSVWLTPERAPVFGGTYFPPHQMTGRPSFRQILLRMIQIYTDERETIESRATQIKEAVSRDLLQHIDQSPLAEEQFHEAAGYYNNQYDEEYGGFSQAPKFPMAMGISFLLKYAHIYNKPEVTRQATHSLKAMMCGGIYDHLGGGFHRYSVDERWHVPHFEKMLYDNALLINALADAQTAAPSEAYRHTAEETFRFLRREMMHPAGGFYSALDADTDGEEGQFYVWDEKEIRKHLSGFPESDIRLFCAVYNVSDAGNWEGTNILHISVDLEQFAREAGITNQKLASILYRAREVLLKAREHRNRPALDDKIITSWNAILLKSLCKASRAFDNKQFAEYAVQLASYLDSTVIQQGSVMRIIKDGKPAQLGFLDDVALLAEAFTYVFELTGNSHWLSRSEQLCNTLIEDFYDDTQAGFFYTSAKHEKLLNRNRDLFDNATPSGSSAAMAALFRCGLFTGNSSFSATARQAADKIMLTASKHSASFGYTLDTVLQMYHHKQEIVISGPEPEPFLKHFLGRPSFTRVMVPSEDASAIPFAPFEQKKPVEGKTSCYLCENFSCQAPVTEIKNL